MGVSMSDQGRTEVSELLQLFFRVISQFLPNLPSKLALFCKLLQKNAKWTWVRKQKEAFRAAKGARYDDHYWFIMTLDGCILAIGITGGDTIARLKSNIGGVARVAWLHQEVALAQSYIWCPKVLSLP